jgi:hypothetical protein
MPKQTDEQVRLNTVAHEAQVTAAIIKNLQSAQSARERGDMQEAFNALREADIAVGAQRERAEAAI